jgi:hypothetical protein
LPGRRFRDIAAALKGSYPRHHQGAVLMRDNVAVNTNIAMTPKIEMATSHEHSAPTSISLWESLRGDRSNAITNCWT